ncbi:glycoside hydrolase family 32 protein [Virgibacillus ihumii]|uniref:glycoside hydrolase family 32 protein n=1 Tax=Virgibacillus ihumii TaxID=2686091 RepID=UPI00157D8693|nr:glycoside hydrolase family 32 protein [Virgibacillus ihumii]
MTVESIQKYKPKLHFAPQKNWMNDPNGLVYFEGEYHLFFQHNPYDSVWGPMHWGHAVSENLIEWRELDIALYPDEHGTIFSGSALVDWHNTTGFFPEKPGLVAIFTHHLEGGKGKVPKQSQSLAYSHDNGRAWKKFNGNPVLEHESKGDFRDPKVFWYEETRRWVMMLATGQTVSIYSSVNLIDWQSESEFGDNLGVHEGVWECPDLFPLKVEGSEEIKWVMFVSIGDNPEYNAGSRTQYFIGAFDGSKFTPEDDSVNWLDFGKDNYAGVSFSDIPKTDGRRIYLGWMSNWQYANQTPTVGWRSQMTLPREISLQRSGEGYKVIQNPVHELVAHFTEQEKIDQVLNSTGEGRTISVQEEYMKLELNIKKLNADGFRISLHHGEEQFTDIVFDFVKNTLTVDRANSGEVDFSDRFLDKQVLPFNNVENLQLQIIVDTSSVELFVNEGECALTSLIYPEKPCEKVSLFASDGIINIMDSYIYVPKGRQK